MPSSNPYNISQIVEWITEIDPKSVLDCGVGFGKYGFLAREYTDIRHGRYYKKDWQVQIDGCEIYHRYEYEIYNYIYDHVFFVDVLECIEQKRNYDLVLLCDIVEHFHKPDAMQLINSAIKYNNNVIISTPNGYIAQGEWQGNKHEIHKCGFEEKDFEKWNVRELKNIKNKLTVWI